MDNKTPFVEICKSKTNRVCRFVPVSEACTYKGYRSIYGFDELAVSYFKDVGTTRGSKNIVTSVYADTLFTDFDDGTEAYDAKTEAEKLWRWLNERGISYNVWDSGGRSIHIEIPHEPIWDKDLPYSHKMFLRSIEVKSDESLFQIGRIFRLPGTIHEKTLRKKTLLESKEGKLLEFPLLKEPPKPKVDACFDGEGVIELAVRLQKVVADPFQDGERNKRFFVLAASVISGGFSADFCRELCEKVNDEMLSEPLDDTELELVINSAIQSMGG